MGPMGYQRVFEESLINMISKSSLLVLIYLNEVLGHGFMYFPTTWNSRNEIKPCNGLKGAHFGFKHELSDDACDPSTGAPCSSSALDRGWTTEWFTNFTFAAGEPSMSEEMYSDKRVSIKYEGEERYNPWSQPGTAPIYGQGCGANGGNPNGCNGDHYDPSPFGTCCGGGRKNGQWKSGCGGYTGGKSALDHYADGLFDGGNFTTTWTRGKAEPVYWSIGAGPHGGYAYRLCKIPAGGVTHITETCFNQGHLYFAGDTNWIYANMKPYQNHDYSKWEEVPAVRTTEGTFPPGSEWTRITVPADKANGWGFKDYVQIPEDIEPGSYILSFRWDSQRTPQVWSNCANIEVV